MREYNLEAPLDRLRLVARERFAFPGGYELGVYIDGDDGYFLCQNCVREEYSTLYRDVKSFAVDVSVMAGCDYDPGEVWCDGCHKDFSAYCDSFGIREENQNDRA